MTKEDWLTLRVGDYVLETGSGVSRRILSVSRWCRRCYVRLSSYAKADPVPARKCLRHSHNPRTLITLRKIGHSWTDRPSPDFPTGNHWTTYCSTDEVTHTRSKWRWTLIRVEEMK